MKIKKITTIKGYKSFVDFSWDRFCKNSKQGNIQELGDFSIIFGENGSGKSSICEILKSVSQNQDFRKVRSANIELEIVEGDEITICQYKDYQWTKNTDKKSILFFDSDFINLNIHTHGVRARALDKGAHTQESGKLIISLDAKANNLEQQVKDADIRLREFKRDNNHILKSEISAWDRLFFQQIRHLDTSARQRNLEETQTDMKNLNTELELLKKIESETEKFNKLAPISDMQLSSSLSLKEDYSELFTRQLIETAHIITASNIHEHFEKHKDFIVYASDHIPSNYENENCPLCMQPLSRAADVIEYYSAIFNQSYRLAKAKFLSDIDNIKVEISQIKKELDLLHKSILDTFEFLEKLAKDFELKDLYVLEDRAKWSKIFTDITIPEFDVLLASLESLKNIDRKYVDIEGIYDRTVNRIAKISTYINDFNEFISEKNTMIFSLINKYSTEQNRQNTIREIEGKLQILNNIISFHLEKKFELITNKYRAIEIKNELSAAAKRAKNSLDIYLTEAIPKKVINNMIAILKKFDLDFSIEHIKDRPGTKDYSFSFKIMDGYVERDFRDGLSEGECQLISLAFFFAINENISEKSDVVLVFDDPITSLDSRNLKTLADLIHEKTQNFSQVIVFTHHHLFYKYLAKCFNPSPSKFNILKNSESFGGSFLFYDLGFDLLEELKECDSEISENAENGSLSLDAISLKYGQLLRLAVEKFIKYELLMWDKEINFYEVIDSLKDNQSKLGELSDNDLETIKVIYAYCNQANFLHIDKEAPSSLAELRSHIYQFCRIIEKVRDET